MDDEAAKSRLLADLRYVRIALVGKVGGLCECDARRPLTPTGALVLGILSGLAWHVFTLTTT